MERQLEKIESTAFVVYVAAGLALTFYRLGHRDGASATVVTDATDGAG